MDCFSRFFVVILTLAISFPSLGAVPDNKDSTSFSLGARFQVGHILAVKSAISKESSTIPTLMQVDLGWTKNTLQAWETYNCYSTNGLSFVYAAFGNTKELGQAIGAVVYAQPVLYHSNRTSFSFRVAAGPSYMTKVYNEKTNPNNLFYSMHLSYLLMVNLNLAYKLSPHSQLNLSTQFNHISNGGTRIPNYGINFPTLSMGYQYNFKTQEFPSRIRAPFMDKKVMLVAQVFAGPRITKHADPLPEERRMVTGINVGVVKRMGRTSALGIGGEFYDDPISKVYKERTGEDFRTLIASVGIQHYLLFGDVFFGQQVLYYVTKHNPDIHTNIYQRYILGYKVKAGWFVGVTLKTHLEVADFAAFTTGFML